MTLKEIVETWLGSGGFWAAVILIFLTLVEITPIKINPWSWLAQKIGSAFNGEIMKEIGSLKTDMGEKIKTVQTEMGKVKQEVKDIKKDVSDIREEAKEREATTRRTRILEFGDEILHGINYSKEHFDQILLDITEYENYCDDHQHYMNNVARATIAHIKKVYQTCLDKDGFL